jgi:hypothetical protein
MTLAALKTPRPLSIVVRGEGTARVAIRRSGRSGRRERERDRETRR